jgi:hypothetical protein
VSETKGNPEKSKAVATAGGSNRKSVAFRSVTIRKTLHRNDYTAQERVATWMTGEEFMEMRNSCLQIAREINWRASSSSSTNRGGGHHRRKSVRRTGGPDAADASSTDAARGLERLSRHRVKVQAERRQVLLDEIVALRQSGCTRNPDDLAALFRSYTARSAIEARAMGWEDEKRANNCYSSSPSPPPPTSSSSASAGAKKTKKGSRTVKPALIDVADTRNDMDTFTVTRRRPSAGKIGNRNVASFESELDKIT